jgi:predicted solute-binding protein
LRPLSAEKAGAELVAGRVDLGPISLAEYLRHTDELLLLPGLAIAADGPVMSCNIAQLLSYYRTLRYGLSDDGLHAIRRFGDLAARRGLVPGDWAVRRFEGER